MDDPIKPEGRYPLTWLERWVKPLTPAPDGKAPPEGLLAFFWYFMRQIIVPFTVATILGVFEVIIDLLIPISLGILVSLLANPEIASGDRMAALWEHSPALLTLLILVMVVGPIVFIAKICVRDLTIMPSFSQLIRWQAHEALMKQDVTFFANEFAGRLATRVMQLGFALRNVLMESSGALLYAVFYLIGAIGVLAWYSAYLAMPVVAYIVVFAILATRFIPEIGRRSHAHSKMRSELTGRVVDSYTNIQTLKLFADPRADRAYVADSMDEANFGWVRVMRAHTWLGAGFVIANALLITATSLIAVWLWANNVDDGAALATALPITLTIMLNSSHLIWVMSGIIEQVGTVAESVESIAHPPRLIDQPDAPALDVRAGEVRFEGLNFTYDGSKAVMEDLNLTIQPGERVGLIGPSGAGKSTLVNLALRFFDPQGGRILIDGQDVAGVTQVSLRRSIAMVTQDTSLLHRSIRDNIRFGRPEASDAQILAAAKKAKALDFLHDLSDQAGRKGLDAHVGERGVKLSGGQRQRVALARVILKDAPILILDEATSALDSQVEAEIQSELLDLMAGKTVIAIAHRLSTIAQLDRLVVMDGGKIVEEGTHQQLLEKGGTYARLWTLQSGGFLGL